MKRAITAVLLGLMTLSTPFAVRADDAIFGWVGSAEVRIPGQGVKLVVVKGVVTAPDPGTALAIAKFQARAGAEQYGDVVVGPTVNLVSPFAIPGIPVGPRFNEPDGGSQICGPTCPKSGCGNSCFNERGHKYEHFCIINNHRW